MRLGSVIIRVQSKCEASELWFFPLLNSIKEQHTTKDLSAKEADNTEADHVSVSADLCDLKQKLEWCRRNDAACRKMADNAGKLYRDFVSREAILDYLQVMCVEIARRTVAPPPWFHVPDHMLSLATPRAAPRLPDPLPCNKGQGTMCAGCVNAVAQVRAAREAQEVAAAAALAAGRKKAMLSAGAAAASPGRRS